MKRRDYNFFKCPNCEKMTKHIRLSQREIDSAYGDNRTAQKLFAVVSDGLGITELVGMLGGPKYYKCCECGQPYIDQ